MRTPAQQQQWEKRFVLGTLIGSAYWIRSKITVIAKTPQLSRATKAELTELIDKLADALLRAAKEARGE